MQRDAFALATPCDADVRTTRPAELENILCRLQAVDPVAMMGALIGCE